MIMVHHDRPVPLMTPLHCCTRTLFGIVVMECVVSLSLAGSSTRPRYRKRAPAAQSTTNGSWTLDRTLPALETSAKRRQECKGC